MSGIMWLPEDLIQVAGDGTVIDNIWTDDRIPFLTTLGFLGDAYRHDSRHSPNKVGVRLQMNAVPGITRWRNSYFPVIWALELCDEEQMHVGEIWNWQAVWVINPSEYDDEMPSTIDNVQYIPDPAEPEVIANRTWREWRSPNHTHYYYTDVDRYIVPTWSWGADIPGTQIADGGRVTGVNVVSRQDFNGWLNQDPPILTPVTE